MVILGAAINHWYHMDMVYRGIINMLMMCGCIGKSGSGWSHYGSGKTAPANRLATAAFALIGIARHMNSTSFFTATRTRARETLEIGEILAVGDEQVKRLFSSSAMCVPSEWAGCLRLRLRKTR